MPQSLNIPSKLPLYRPLTAACVACSIERDIEDMQDALVRARSSLKAARRTREDCLLLCEQAEREEAAAQQTTNQIQSQLCWGHGMSQDLFIRVLRAAGGRGRRLMAAACREFASAVGHGRASNAFPRERRIVILGSCDGQGVEAYEEENPRWEAALHATTQQLGAAAAHGLPPMTPEQARRWAGVACVQRGKTQLLCFTGGLTPPPLEVHELNTAQVSPSLSCH